MTVRRTVWLRAGAAAIPLFIAVCAFGSTASADVVMPRDRVVFVVVPGLRWATMPPSFDGWAKASLALNSVPRQRPIDVYLTMAKGRRTGGLPAVAGVGPLDVRGAGISVRNWARLEQRDRRLRYGGHLGQLGQLLEDHGVPVAVVGRSADVAALAADHSGNLGGLTLGDPSQDVEAVGPARLVMVEAEVADLVRLRDATAGACRIVASGSAPADGGLGAIAVSPECGFGRAGLVSPSTRQPGFVTLPDIAPTLLSLVGVAPPNVFEGGVVRAAHPVSRSRLVEEDRRSGVSRDVGRPLTTVFLLAAVAGLIALSRERLRLPVAAVMLAMPAALLLMMLVPWWRYGRLAGIATLVVIAGLLAVATVAGAGPEPARVVFVLTAVTTGVIAFDALRRGMLELDAPTVNNAIAAGRFAGVGNVPYGFLAASSIVAAALALERYGRRALVAVAVGLGFIVFADGAPMFGADAGGVLASVPAIGVLLLTWQGRRRWRILAVPAVAGLCALAAFAALDISRPAAERTHLGRTLTGGSAAQTFVRREISALSSFRTSQWVIVAAVALFGLVVVRGRVPTGTALRAGMAAIGVAAVIGAAANDSGVAVAGAILFVAWGVGLALAQPLTRAERGDSTFPDSEPQPAGNSGAMRIGVVLPQTEIGSDRDGLRRYAEGVEELGFAHLLAYDHVVGADPAVHQGWDGPYDVRTTFHEPFVLFGYLAALIGLELVTGIIILPQRQTALVAKQAAEVDLLTEGHFRLGVGIGWNAVEYEALGKRFSDRGARLEEQVTLLRRLWTETTVTFEGEHERVTGAGLAPMPRQRPIPIWLGGSSEPAYRRMGRLADGWFPQMQPGPKLDAARAIIDESARAAGRDPASIGMEGRVSWQGDVADTVDRMDQWEKAGASHVAVNTMGAGLGSVDDHLRALAEVAARRPPG